MTERVGFDLTGFQADYNKSAEENLKAMREAYRRVYGKYPEDDKDPKQSPPPRRSRRSTGR